MGLWPFSGGESKPSKNNVAYLALPNYLKHVSKSDPEISVFEIFDLSQFTDHNEIEIKESLKDGFSFALFVNKDDGFYVKLIGENDSIRQLSNSSERRWGKCYVFNHKTLDFYRGRNLVFKNQLINSLKNTGNFVYNDFNVKEVVPSEVMTVSEQEDYESFWKECLNVLYSSELYTVGWSLFKDKDEMFAKKLFNNGEVSDKNNAAGKTIELDEIPYVMAFGTEELTEYTLQDELGNTISSRTIHHLTLNWLKELFKIPKYKEIIMKIVEKEVDTAYYFDSRIFSHQSDPVWTMEFIDTYKKRKFGLNLLKSIDKDNGVTYRREYLSNNDMKKRLVILSNVLGVRFNFKEEIMASFPEYDENFVEDLAKEKTARTEALSKLVKKLEIQESKDLIFFNSLTNNNGNDDLKLGSAHDEGNNDAVSETSQVIEHLKSNPSRSAEEFDNVIEELNSFNARKTVNSFFGE